MKETTKTRLDLFTQNYQIIKGKFIWQNSLLKRLSALLYTADNKVIDCDAIRESYDLIKENTSAFSYFRGNTMITIATLLSLKEDKKNVLNNTMAVYDLMKDYKFRSSDYLVIAAYQIAANTTSDNYLAVVRRARAFYDGMKNNHYLLTNQNDYIYCAMLAMSNIDIPSSLEQMEQFYRTFKPIFYTGNGVQALSHVLILGEDYKELESRVLSLRDLFRQNNIKLDKENTLPSLGILALLPNKKDELVYSVQEVFQYLRSQKGFGSWSIASQELLLLSLSLITYGCMDEINSNIITTTLSTSLTNIILAQQASMAAAVAASSAAASASSSS